VPGPALGAAVRAGFTTIGIDATIAGALDEVRQGPRPRSLAVGVVDARTTRLERQDEVDTRLREALALCDTADLYLNPNMGLEFLPRAQAGAKLRLLSEAKRRFEGA
jgi:methionine synthase II (cobalamin-independent)